MQKNNNYYEVLGASRDANKDEIKKAFKAAARISHPDKGGTDEDFQAVNLAYQILNDEKKRATYGRVSKRPNLIEFVQELKMTGSKDGKGPVSKAAPDARMGSTTRTQQS